MSVDEIAVKLQETYDRTIRNEGRIKKLESESAALHELATSVALMAEQMKNMNKSVSKLTGEVEELREKPSKRWESLVEKIIWAIAAAFIGFILAQLGL